jgi:chromosome segregation ATPase
MTEQTPAEQLQSELNRLEFELDRLRSDARLTGIRDSVEDLQTTVQGLDRRIRALREQGYAFEKELENRAEDFEQDWAEIAPNIESQISRESRNLELTLRPLEREAADLIGSTKSASSLLPRVKSLASRLESLENQAEAAEQSIRGMYDQFQAEINQTINHLKDVEWTLTELSEANFQLLATESAILAVKAAWARGGKKDKDNPEGVLYLTDQRLLFEQKEKVATKKVLFIATEKELVQELLWEIPVELIQEIKSSDAGFLKRGDYLELKFDSRADLDTAQIRIWQPGEIWVSLINRAKAREFDQNRAIALDQEAVEKVQEAPTQCESCGGAIDQVVLRGMDTITCEYCGTVIRL